jgi:hypothetical protein
VDKTTRLDKTEASKGEKQPRANLYHNQKTTMTTKATTADELTQEAYTEAEKERRKNRTLDGEVRFKINKKPENRNGRTVRVTTGTTEYKSEGEHQDRVDAHAEIRFNEHQHEAQENARRKQETQKTRPNTRHVHHVDENGEEHKTPAKNKYRAAMEYQTKKARYDQVRVTDEDGEYCDESEL